MSQFGMTMPGGRRKAAMTPDVYTGLLFVAFAALTAASVMLFLAGSKVGPDGNAFGLQDAKNVKLSSGR